MNKFGKGYRYRPKWWIMGGGYSSGTCGKDDNLFKSEVFESGADQLLIGIVEAIREIENPYDETRECADEDGVLERYDNPTYKAFETCRNTIMELLNGE
jgi:hypothetical protein